MHRGQRAGLVGPNGAGKTAIFLLITREHGAHDGAVITDKGITLGYFSQGTGDMHGHSAPTTWSASGAPYGTLQEQRGTLEGYALEARVRDGRSRTGWGSARR